MGSFPKETGSFLSQAAVCENPQTGARHCEGITIHNIAESIYYVGRKLGQ